MAGGRIIRTGSVSDRPHTRGKRLPPNRECQRPALAFRKGNDAMYTIRPYKATTEEEYAALVAIHNAAWPEEPETIASWRFHNDRRPTDILHQRFVVESGGQLVTEGTYMELYWSTAPDKYEYGYSCLPAYEDRADLHQLIYEYVLAQLAERQPKVLATDTREDRSSRVEWLNSQGFVVKMRFPISELDVTDFDFSRFHGAQERVAAAGVVILPLTELRERDSQWMEKLYEMIWEIEQDAPGIDPPKKEPFEEFAKRFGSPNYWPEGWQMAIDPAAGDDGVGAYVGVSMLAKNPPMPQRIETGLTGVVRSHRRKGIALAIKLRAIKFAIQNGGTVIRTDNEENNPMLGINKMLGFVEIPAYLELVKEL